MRPSVRRVLSAFATFLTVVLAGGVAVWWFGEGEYNIEQSIYFALITVSTVGYGELPNLESHPAERLVIGLVIVAGIGAAALFQSTLTAMLVEGVIGKAFRKRRMDRKINKLTGHFVVAGGGRTGRYIIEELKTTARAFVVVDRDEQHLEKLNQDFGGTLLYVLGDATEDHTLVDARVDQCAGVVATLADDRDNLFITLSARSMNSKARIISKVVEAENEPKLIRAGADQVVSPHRIGGLRMASELVRPKVTGFLDQMLRVTKNLRFEEVTVPEHSSFSGKTLRAVPIREKTNLLVIALHLPNDTYIYNPPPDHVLTAGTNLIVMGETDNVSKLHKLVRE